MTLCIGTTLLSGCAPRPAQNRPEAEGAAPSQAVTEEAPPAAPADQQSVGWTTTPLAVASEPVAVKEGSAPLVYLVETPGLFRVRDLTAGKDLASANAAGRSIVRVDARSGVVFGRETLAPGPLDKDHRYAIYRDATGPNMARQGTFQLRPPPKAQSPQDRPQ